MVNKTREAWKEAHHPHALAKSTGCHVFTSGPWLDFCDIYWPKAVVSVTLIFCLPSASVLCIQLLFLQLLQFDTTHKNILGHRAPGVSYITEKYVQ